MQSKIVYDIIGIGIGPFNLGLAALTEPMANLNCLFFEQNKEFNWHPGLMLPNARLQVPFYADLVTLADPCSKFSYLSFLKAKQRMFRFAILENNFILRKEYNEYCQWVSNQLSCLRFGFFCEAIYYDETAQLYSVHVNDVVKNAISVFQCKHVVIGVGTVPYVPECCRSLLRRDDKATSPGLRASLATLQLPPQEGERDGPLVFHSSEYLYFKERVLTKKSVTIVGSGQSAAEIFYDLLSHSSQFSQGLNWLTKGDGFSPMDYSKLSLEKTSPDYIDHFYSLADSIKKERLISQNHLYKGINFSLIDAIYNELYEKQLYDDVSRIKLYPNSMLEKITQATNDAIELQFYHSELDKKFSLFSEMVILATGYRHLVPDFIKPLTSHISWLTERNYSVNRNYSINKSNSIFVQNAELHTHGFNSPDLGMGPYRNAVIINSILGYEHFVMETNIAFQQFNPLINLSGQ